MPSLADLQDPLSPAVLFECVGGSHAYGTAGPESDVDIRGVFALPAAAYLALEVPPAQVADERSNIVYYSLRRTLELLAAGNPNILELLWMPDDCIRRRTPEMAELERRRAMFVTRECVDAHLGYAFSQIKKARGQNKWINNPKPEQPPAKESYCHVIPRARLAPRGDDAGAPPARPLPLAQCGIELEHCRAARVEHARDLFRLYDYGPGHGVFRGDAIVCESIPVEDEAPRFVGLLLWNEQAWQQAMTDHRNYWTWRRERNEARWQQQERGEIDFDAKNLMHTIRLLLSGKAMLERGEPIVRFEGAALETLRAVRAGRFSYDEIMRMAQGIVAECEALKTGASLPANVDAALASGLLRGLTANWETRCRATPR